jgi:hypothetical protein
MRLARTRRAPRLLLARGGAVVHRHYRFTIRLNDRIGGEALLVKIDPGGKATGIAVATDADGNTPAKILGLFELSFRGRQISEALTARRAFRRRRRGANLRHRTVRLNTSTGSLASLFNAPTGTTSPVPAFGRTLSTLAFRRQSPAEVFDACCG